MFSRKKHRVKSKIVKSNKKSLCIHSMQKLFMSIIYYIQLLSDIFEYLKLLFSFLALIIKIQG